MSAMIHIARTLLKSFGKDERFITYTGKQVFILQPRIEDIDMVDIGHALSQICRFGGHCREFYSVAQHSLLVHNIVSKSFSEQAVEPIRGFFDAVTVATSKDIRTSIMHDAPEAYLGDVIRPLKVFLPVYRFIERLWWNVTPHPKATPWREDRGGVQPWPKKTEPLDCYSAFANFMSHTTKRPYRY